MTLEPLKTKREIAMIAKWVKTPAALARECGEPVERGPWLMRLIGASVLPWNPKLVKQAAGS